MKYDIQFLWLSAIRTPAAIAAIRIRQNKGQYRFIIIPITELILLIKQFDFFKYFVYNILIMDIELVAISRDYKPIWPSDDRVSFLMKEILESKRQNMASARFRLVDRSILIGGDLFTMGYVGFQGLQTLIPSIASATGIGLVCGVVGGAINIGVGFVCLVNGLKNIGTDNKLALRLILDFFCLTAIGAIMIIATLSAKVALFAVVGAIIAAHPWLLPVLFLAITIPTMIELVLRIKNIHDAKDFGSKLQLNTLKNYIENRDWGKIEELYENDKTLSFKNLNSHPDLFNVLSNKMEQLQEDVGSEGAVAIFDLLIQIKDHNVLPQQIEVVEKELANWSQALNVRMFQQIVYILSFFVSMVALSPSLPRELVTALQNLFLSVANLIPLYMDTFWPFRGNTPMAVERVI